MTNHPIISVVFISWNRKELLQAAMQSLKDQDYPAMEFIVVDNGSTDGSLEWLRESPDIKLIENGKNIGASAARNQGTRLASGKYVIYMDSDAELRTPNALHTFVECMEQDQSIGGMAGIYFTDEALNDLWCWTPCMDWEANHDASSSLVVQDPPQVLTTCYSIYPINVIQEIGGFDEYFFYLYEDGDLCERIRKAGYRLVVKPDIQILHRYADKGRLKHEQIEYHYYHERLRLYFLIKNWGVKRFLRSFLKKWLGSWKYLKQFHYLTYWDFLKIYGIRPVSLLLRYYWICKQRKRKWI
jgi:GT2 family glycosyltransferase